MITIALPTGSLLESSLDRLAAAGVADLRRGLGRRLLAEVEGIRVVLVKPADVAAYVDHGAADLGVVGKDQLWEWTGTLYELVDLGFGGCTLVVAVPEGSALDGPGTWPPSLRVATKYVRSTQAYMERLGQTAEVVALHGSVELAPLVGLVDAIVDLTATGTTLRENHLRVVDQVGRSTARLVANRASMKTRSERIVDLVARLRAAGGRG